MVNSRQIGYLRPQLHNGWALSECLLPPLKEDGGILATLLINRQRIADDLRSGGQLVQKAKRMIALKQTVFQTDLPKYLLLHEALAMHIANAGEKNDDVSAIHNYFIWLSAQSNAYEQISQLYEILNEVFITNSCIDQQSTWLNDQPDHPATHFLACLGPILAQGCQHPTSRFGRQILHALYHQIWAFQQEIFQDFEHSSTDIGLAMVKSLNRDCACFELDPLESVTTLSQKAVAEHLNRFT